MCMRIGTVAVRVARIIMEVGSPARNQLLEYRSHVVQERGLELVDEGGDRCMKTGDQEQAVPYARTVYDLLNALGDIKELLTFLRVDLDRVSAHLHREPPLPSACGMRARTAYAGPNVVPRRQPSRICPRSPAAKCADYGPGQSYGNPAVARERRSRTSARARGEEESEEAAGEIARRWAGRSEEQHSQRSRGPGWR